MSNPLVTPTPTPNTDPTRIPSWDIWFMMSAVAASRRSKDPSTQVGCVIVNPQTNSIVSTGYNGFVRGTKESPERWERPEKYRRVKHAEENAVALAARNGIKIDGCIAYVTHFPCSDRCAGLLIQAGISQVVVLGSTSVVGNNKGEVADSIQRARELFAECDVLVEVIDYNSVVSQFAGVYYRLFDQREKSSEELERNME